ncbi:YciI family protein [Nonomuraea longicatena]|uniref:YciI family protein n=1 Tax=Nonomuraea longicatena TaxID=83682 RepID=A0ABN1PZI1_9ACTN
MKYALLLYSATGAWAEASEQEQAAIMAEHEKFTALLVERGALVGGEALHGPEQGVTLRRSGGDALRTDGPFAETVEHLGGFYIVEAADLDAAIELARACPEEIVEVRPVVESSG